MTGTARRKLDKRSVVTAMNIDNPDNPAVVAHLSTSLPAGNAVDARTRPDMVLGLKRGN